MVDMSKLRIGAEVELIRISYGSDSARTKTTLTCLGVITMVSGGYCTVEVFQKNGKEVARYRLKIAAKEITTIVKEAPVKPPADPKPEGGEKPFEKAEEKVEGK